MLDFRVLIDVSLYHQTSDKKLLWMNGKGKRCLIEPEIWSSESWDSHSGKAEVLNQTIQLTGLLTGKKNREKFILQLIQRSWKQLKFRFQHCFSEFEMNSYHFGFSLVAVVNRNIRKWLRWNFVRENYFSGKVERTARLACYNRQYMRVPGWKCCKAK